VDIIQDRYNGYKQQGNIWQHLARKVNLMRVVPSLSTLESQKFPSEKFMFYFFIVVITVLGHQCSYFPFLKILSTNQTNYVILSSIKHHKQTCVICHLT
jgi:hypothetical protein